MHRLANSELRLLQPCDSRMRLPPVPVRGVSVRNSEPHSRLISSKRLANKPPDLPAPEPTIRNCESKMKLCAVSESLGNLSLPEAAKASAGLGLAALEIGMGNWSAATHADLKALLESKDKRHEFLSVFKENGLSLAALNCNGNQLHPVDGERQSKVVYDTVRVAELLGVDIIVLMSGLPAGGPNDLRPNWVTCA